MYKDSIKSFEITITRQIKAIRDYTRLRWVAILERYFA